MKVDEILSVGGLSHRPPVLRALELRERHRRVGWLRTVEPVSGVKGVDAGEARDVGHEGPRSGVENDLAREEELTPNAHAKTLSVPARKACVASDELRVPGPLQIPAEAGPRLHQDAAGAVQDSWKVDLDGGDPQTIGVHPKLTHDPPRTAGLRPTT